MGRCPHNKAGGQKKKYSHKQARRTKFLKKGDDIIFNEVQKTALAEAAAAQLLEGRSGGEALAAGVAGGAAAALGDAQGSSPGKGTAGVLDDDLPGMGQHYCMFCDRHFASEAVKTEHNKSKMHKKRMRLMKTGPRPHCQLDAELAAGMGRPDNGTDSKMEVCRPQAMLL